MWDTYGVEDRCRQVNVAGDLAGGVRDKRKKGSGKVEANSSVVMWLSISNHYITFSLSYA